MTWTFGSFNDAYDLRPRSKTMTPAEWEKKLATHYARVCRMVAERKKIVKCRTEGCAEPPAYTFQLPDRAMEGCCPACKEMLQRSCSLLNITVHFNPIDRRPKEESHGEAATPSA